MCEFVIQGEPHREMASAIISQEEPVGRHITRAYTSQCREGIKHIGSIRKNGNWTRHPICLTPN